MASKPLSSVQPVRVGNLPASCSSRPALVLRWLTCVCTLASNTSRAKVDLPEPLTPVTATKRCKGISTLTFCKLWRLAPLSSNHLRVVLTSCGALIALDASAAARTAAAACAFLEGFLAAGASTSFSGFWALAMASNTGINLRVCKGCFMACSRYLPVCESTASVMSLTLPCATNLPPRLPALGPMSMM